MLGFRSKRDRDKDRYYLLPGMGGSSHRRKHKKTLMVALVVGVFMAGLLALLLRYMNNKPK